MTRIAGIVRKRWSEGAASDLEKMRAGLVHEPSEVTGSWVHESVGAGLAWAGRPGSSAERLSIRDETGNIFLVFCGELFADSDETKSVDANGNRVDRQCAERLLRLYEEVGFAFPERLNGGFCGVLVDLKRNQAVLFNDRYGTRRIYWHQNNDGFYFASEAKSLLAVDPQLRQLDTRGLGEFLTCGCVLQNRTLFNGISILPGGVRWAFHPGGRVERKTYFSPQTWESQPMLGRSEYAGRLRDTLRRVLPLYANGNQPIGVSLTGGIDSRLILAFAKGGQGGLSCYTFGGPYAECADVRFARRIAKTCGLAHQTIRVGSEFLRQFPALAEKTVYLSDGAMDVSGAVELYVNQRAREIAPVRLTGNYGSEILRSRVAFKPQKLDGALFDGELVSHLRRAAATYVDERRCPRISFIAFKQVPWHHFARSAIEQSQVTMRSPYLDNELVKLAYQAPPEMATNGAYLLQLAYEGNAALGRFATDRALRLHPIPILSRFARFYQEFTARAEYAYDYGMPQWLARLDNRLSSLQLERLFLGRHKFYHFRLWYRDALAEFVRDVLLDPRALQRPYVSRRRLQEIVGRHTSGEGNYTVEIHKLLTLELLQRLLLERN